MSVKFIATVAGVTGPAGKNETEALSRLREYMESFIGKRHFHDVNTEMTDADYQEALFKLYDREERGTLDEIGMVQLKSC